MRQFEYQEAGKRTIYLGWNRSLSPPPEFIALVQDEDQIDVLALDAPTDLAGVGAYVSDEPCCQLLGVWRKHEPVRRPVANNEFPLRATVHQLLRDNLNQETYDLLITMLENEE